MLAFAFRRAIWAIPTLFGISLVVFLLTTLLPDPEVHRATDETLTLERVDELRRSQFLDLPRLVNVKPHDARAAATACLEHIRANDALARSSEGELARLGGAALPHVLPHLGELDARTRERVAFALEPVARRMGLAEKTDFDTAEHAVVFWQHYWTDRSADFTDASVRRAVQRIVLRGSEWAEDDIRHVDTFALRNLIVAMRATQDPSALERLTALASHVTGRSLERPSSEGEDERRTSGTNEATHWRATVSDWLSWWHVHGADYVMLEGGEKLAASVTQTRYAKWVLGAVTGRLGLSTRDGLPIVDKLVVRAPVTLGMTLAALFVSVLVGVPLGVVAAWRRGQTIDRTAAAFVLLMHAVPTFLIAELLDALGSASRVGVALPVLTLSTVSLAVMTQQQRTSMIDALSQDYVRSARAKGARSLRVAVVHALRNALVPTVTLAGVQFPVLLGAAFVVEEVFEIRGMGWETLRAIESRDLAWIVAVTLLSGIVTTAGLVASDITYGVLDPRVRSWQTRGTVS